MSHVILEALLTLLKHKRENLQIFVALLKCSGKKTAGNFFFLLIETLPTHGHQSSVPVPPS